MLKVRSSERIEFIDPEHEDTRTLFDLSKGGACILYNKRVERGAFVKVTLDALELRARISYAVERTDGYRIGMQFWNVSGAQQKALDELVDRFSRGVPIRCRVSDEPAVGGRQA
jgi:c-di-GMP-binding flagellar brake protein YcgR